MRTTRSTLALLLATALALTALSHLHSHSWLVLRLDTERTQYAPAAERPDAPVPVPAAAARVWIVIIDGLRSDAIDDMPALAELAERGVRRTLRAEFPSYTTASLTALATGVEPFYSGVRLNTGR